MLNRMQKKLEGNPNKLADPDNEQFGAVGNTAHVSDLIAIKRIYGNAILMKDGTYRMVVRCGAVNLDLKGEEEKVNILHTFGELLNGLNLAFPLQMLLHSSSLDTQTYVQRYLRRIDDPSLTPQMRQVILGHLEFFEAQARQNYLLDRTFYAVIPYFGDGIDGPGGEGIGGEMPMGGMIKALFDKSTADSGELPDRRTVEKARYVLGQRASYVMQQLGRLNIQSAILDEIQTVALLREMYNPGISQRQRIRSVQGQDDLVLNVRTSTGERGRGRASNASRTQPRPQLGPGGA